MNERITLDEAVEILENTAVTPDIHPDDLWKWDEAVRIAISELKSKRDKLLR